MTIAFDSTVQRRLRDRQALLWVCQGYDLREEQKPHGLDVPAEAALGLYRAPTVSDGELMGFFWEAVWLEGAKSPILESVKSIGVVEGTRSPIVLAGPDDANAVFSEYQFQPICVLPGRLDLGPDSPAGQRYGGFARPRQREKVAESLAQRLAKYSHRVLIVLGSRSSTDLDRYLYPVLEDNPIMDLDLVVVYPPDVPAPTAPANLGIRFHSCPGTLSDFLAALRAIGVPTAKQPVGWTVRVKHPGKEKVTGVRLAPDVVQRILDQFELITESDLQPPAQFTVDNLIAFLDGTPSAWAGYASGLPVARAYVTKDDRSLADELYHSLSRLELVEPAPSSTPSPRRRSLTITLPCREGSGATTLLREAAFAAAGRGYPTLVLRPGVTDIDLEMLAAFTTGLTEAILSANFETAPPVAVVLDIEVADVGSARRLAGTIAAKGRPLVVLRAVPAKPGSDQTAEPPLGQLRVLDGAIAKSEVAACERTFRDLVTRWTLPISPLPTHDDWLAYQDNTSWKSGRGDEPPSLFWVALRFFLMNGLSREHEETLQDALGRWIRERNEKVTNPEMRKILVWVAALSSQRIVCPLAVAMRPVTGGEFSSALLPAFETLGALVEWQDFSRDLDDSTLRFRHPALADEYLRQQGVGGLAAIVQTLRPLMQALVPGRSADQWVAEQFVHIVTPRYHERSGADWEWRLAAFDAIPLALATGSRVILHHWARCLYISSEQRYSPNLPINERQRRLDLSIRHLQNAIALPQRQLRDEHPSFLWNTLGVAYAHRASFVEESDTLSASGDWNRAWEAFQQSIDLLPGNIDPLAAFSRRLLEHAGAVRGKPSVEPTPTAVAEVATALGLLDEADEVLNEAQDPDPDTRAELAKYRSAALAWLGEGRVEVYLASLRTSEDPELSFYCQARLVADHDPKNVAATEKALKILESASQLKPLSPRSLRLQLSLLRRHPDGAFDFDKQLPIYEALDRAAGNKLRPIEAFRLAVLYFQVGEYGKGNERFRQLREFERRADIAIPAIRDVWRRKDNPHLPRLARVRVTRMTNEWRAEGYVDELGLTLLLRPRHFAPQPELNHVVECGIRFEFRGPLAVPKRFVSTGE